MGSVPIYRLKWGLSLFALFAYRMSTTTTFSPRFSRSM
jgi:hypothetical protein